MATTTTERDGSGADWQRRVVDRSLRSAARRSIDRGAVLVAAAATLLERSQGDGFTVQDVADEAGQSLRTLYQHFASKDDLLLALFEESMRGYAQLIRGAISPFDDPRERLAGALLAAVRLPGTTTTGSTRGLMRVRLRLTQVQPGAVGRAREPVAALLRDLVAGVAATGPVSDDADGDAALFALLSLTTTSITTEALGSDQGPGAPDDVDLVAFCLRGLGAPVERAGLDDLGSRLHLPRRRVSVETPFADPPPAEEPP